MRMDSCWVPKSFNIVEAGLDFRMLTRPQHGDLEWETRDKRGEDGTAVAAAGDETHPATVGKAERMDYPTLHRSNQQRATGGPCDKLHGMKAERDEVTGGAPRPRQACYIRSVRSTVHRPSLLALRSAAEPRWCLLSAFFHLR